MKYLVITEGDEEFYQADTITDDDKAACDDGILSFVDTEAKPMTTYFAGEWLELMTWGESNEC